MIVKGVDLALKQLKARHPMSYFLFEGKDNAPVHYYEAPDSNQLKYVYANFRNWCKVNSDSKQTYTCFCSKKKNPEFEAKEHTKFQFKLGSLQEEENIAAPIIEAVAAAPETTALIDLINELKNEVVQSRSAQQLILSRLDEYEEEEEDDGEEEEEEEEEDDSIGGINIDKTNTLIDGINKLLDNPKVDILIAKISGMFNGDKEIKKNIQMSGTSQTPELDKLNVNPERTSEEKQENIKQAIISLIKNDKDFDIVLIKLAKLQIVDNPKYNFAKTML